jgi:putrescine aminotransferase
MAQDAIGGDSRFWHPFGAMGQVRSAEFVVARADDVWIWDEDGNRYLDATASLWYMNVGHGRREIADAVHRQMVELDAFSTFNDLANRPALDLAEKLAELAPVDDARIFLTSGGGDSIDAAAKLVRRYWSLTGEPGRTKILHRTHAYHGTHGFGTSLAGIPANRDGFGPLAPDGVEVAHDSLAAVRAAVEREGGETLAAIFAEPVIGAGGVHPPEPGYLEGLAEICAETGALFVIDDVICAFGRLGHWFSAERWGLKPDLITFAKGVTSGYLPLGGVVVSGRVAEPFWGAPEAPAFRHGATYAGHPACCAAALANIDLLERDGLVGRGAELEDDLLAAIGPLAERDEVVELRGGVGTMAAVELAPELLAAVPGGTVTLAVEARSHGVIVRPLGSALALSPPLTATPEHFALAADAIDRTLAAHAPAAAGADR